MTGRAWGVLAALALLTLGGLGALLLIERDDAPPALATPGDLAPPGREAARCVSSALALSRAAFELTDPAYVLEGPGGETRGRFTDEAYAANIVRLDTSPLPEGRYELSMAGLPALPFTVDRTPPRLLGTEPSLASCPGPALTVRMAAGEEAACGPVACVLQQGRADVASVAAKPDGDGLVCTLDTAALADASGDWRLLLRDAANNTARVALDWPVPALSVSAPPSAQPGTLVTARATGTPAGGDFAVALLAGGTDEPEVTTQDTPRGSVATIRFRAPRDSQVVGLDVAYRAGKACPIVRPRPAEVEVSTDTPGRRYDAPKPSACGNGQMDPGEACDPGAEGTPACDYDCTASRCGDGVLNPYAGEQCDGGLGCTAACVLACGNGRLDGLERCDDGGESATCNLDCTRARCGDEITNFAAGEECDDGGLVGGDGCSAVCKVEGDFEEEDPSLGLGRWIGRG